MQDTGEITGKNAGENAGENAGLITGENAGENMGRIQNSGENTGEHRAWAVLQERAGLEILLQGWSCPATQTEQGLRENLICDLFQLLRLTPTPLTQKLR